MKILSAFLISVKSFALSKLEVMQCKLLPSPCQMRMVVFASVIAFIPIISIGRMVYDYDSGPAWRKAAGLSPITWVDDSESSNYGVVQSNNQDQSCDVLYERQAIVEGSTANYLKIGFGRDFQALKSAVQRGDSKQADAVLERIRKFRREHQISLVEWSGVANGLGKTADRFAKTANVILSESFLDEQITMPTSAIITIRDYFNSRTPEAKRYEAKMAQRKFNLNADAAIMYTDSDNPFYEAFSYLRREYSVAGASVSNARTVEDLERAKAYEYKTMLSIRRGADFVVSHKTEDPMVICAFLQAWVLSGYSGNAKAETLDVLYSKYVAAANAAKSSGNELSALSWFSEKSSDTKTLR